MQLSTTLLPLFLAAPALLGDPARHEALMEEIERAVVLPEGAEPLQAYGRSYAFSGETKVVATYLIPSPQVEPNTGCEVITEDFRSRPCTEQERQEATASDARRAAAATPAGKRRWFDDQRYLSSISDGGCGQVNVEYDVAAHKVLTIECNGVA